MTTVVSVSKFAAPIVALIIWGVSTAQAQLLTGYPGLLWVTDLENGNTPVIARATAYGMAADDANGMIYISDKSRLLVSRYAGPGLITDPRADTIGYFVTPEGERVRRVRGLAFVNGRLIGSGGSSRGGPQGLYDIDPKTAVATLLAPGLRFDGLGYNPDDGFLYGIGGFREDAALFRVDLETWETDAVVGIPLEYLVGGNNKYQGLSIGDGLAFFASGQAKLPTLVFNLDSGRFEAPLAAGARSDDEEGAAAAWTPGLLGAELPGVTTPTGLFAEAGDDFVELNWDSNSGPTVARYDVFRSAAFEGGPFELIANSKGSAFIDVSVTNDITYYYFVVAVDGAGTESEPSNLAEATPKAPEVEDPARIGVSNVSAGFRKKGRDRRGRVIVFVRDALDQSVSNALVTGTFNGDFNETVSVMTNRSGRAILRTTATVRSIPRYTFCVDDVVAAGFAYDPSLNSESCDRR